MGWTIIPTDGVEDKGNGKYVFTPQSQDTTYIITYTDGETSGTIEYTVKATDCMVCDCSKFTFTKIVSQIPAVGYDTDTLIGTLTGACISNSKEMDSYISPVVTEGNNAVESVSTATTDENTVGVYARIKSNPGDTRTIKIRFDITNSYMAIKESCPTEYSFTQAANGCYSEPAPTVSPSLIDNVPSDGDNYDVTYQETNCWIIESVEYDADIIELNGTYNFDVYPNSGDQPRQTTLTYTFRNRVTNLTSDSDVVVKQKANACATAANPVACFDMGQSGCDTYRTNDEARTNIYVKYTGVGDCWRYKSNWYEGNVRGVTGNENGSNITITSNTTSSEVTSKVHYIFEYIPNPSRTAESVVNIIQSVNECVGAADPVACFDMGQSVCDTFNTSDAARTNIYVKYTGLGNCWRYKSNWYEGNVRGVTEGDNGSNITITSNTTSSEVTSKVHYIFEFIQDTSITAESIVKIIQGVNDCRTAPEPTVCLDMMQSVCTAYTATSAQEMQVYAKFTGLGDCWRYKSYGKTGNVKQNGVTVDGNNSVIALSANTVATSTDSEVYYVFTNDTTGLDVTKTVKITQPAGVSCCDVVTFDIGRENHLFDMDAATVILDGAVLTINNNSCSINDFSIVPYPSSGLTSYQFTDNHNNTYGLTLELPTVTEPEVLILKLMHQGSHDCNKSMMIYRRCYCGSDNCRNVYRNPISGDLGDIIEDNPLYLKSYYTDGVSVPNTYDTFAINKGEMYEDEACTIPITTGWSKTNGWCTAEYFDNGNCFMIHYTAQENHTNSERSITFTYYTKENTIMNNCVPRYEGKHACRKFTVTIFQAADGYEYCDCNTIHPYGIDPETGRHYRMQCLFADVEKYEDAQGQHSKCNCVNNCKQCTDL